MSRMLIALAGFLVWVVFQGFLAGLLGCIGDLIPRYAVAGAGALVPLVLLWQLVPGVSGVLGGRQVRVAAASSLALFVPFIVIALRTGMEYRGVSVQWAVYAVALLLLAASEEVVCRGFLMDALSFGNSRLTGLLLSSSVFAMLHLGNDNASTAGIANIFLAGAFFGFVRIVTDGLLYPVALHWLWNLMTGMVFGWNVSGHTLMPAVFSPVSRPPWGCFGPEESVLMTVGTVGAILILLKRIYLPDDQASAGIETVPGGKTDEVDP